MSYENIQAAMSKLGTAHKVEVLNELMKNPLVVYDLEAYAMKQGYIK
jgi:hypothetical protein